MLERVYFGIANTRQLALSMACQRAESVVEVQGLQCSSSNDKDEFYHDDDNDGDLHIQFANDATLYMVTDTPLVYNSQWQALLEQRLQKAPSPGLIPSFRLIAASFWLASNIEQW